MRITSMNDLYAELLREMYDGERQMAMALLKEAKSATSPDLKTALELHFAETTHQAERLEQVFMLLGVNGSDGDCEVMRSLIEDAEGMTKTGMNGKILDAALVAAAQKAEHYEIAAYATLCEYARLLGYTEQETLLRQTLEEEEATAVKLTRLGAADINETAAAA